tara:strand:+ start:2797 stop:4401 length:1605 start_codon:yes stop_codon:yes gene_type:complete
MLTSTHGVGYSDSAARLVSVQVHRTKGARIHASGIAWNALRHSLARIYAAFETCQYPRPSGAITLHVGPEMKHVSTAHLDLPIAIGLLASMECVPNDIVHRALFFGELALDGVISHTACNTHILALSNLTRSTRHHKQEHNAPNLLEAYMPSLACEKWTQKSHQNWNYRPSDHLKALVEHLNSGKQLPIFRSKSSWLNRRKREYSKNPEFEQIQLPSIQRMAMIVAAAGKHHALIIGSPGTGKSMMSRCIHELLPPLTESAAMQLRDWGTTRGELIPATEVPPFRAPHSQTSTAGLLGSSNKNGTVAGECTMAHGGLLALDEFPEFNRKCIESLRAPMENQSIQIGRVHGAIDLPFQALVIATANPCPCGFFQDRQRQCSCSAGAVKRYLHRITGPISSRFPIHMETTSHRTNRRNTTSDGPPWMYSLEAACEAVSSVRSVLHTKHLDSSKWSSKAEDAIRLHAQQHGCSMREIQSLKSIALTHSLLLKSNEIGLDSIAFACQMRIFSRPNWWENGQNTTWRAFLSDTTKDIVK